MAFIRSDLILSMNGRNLPLFCIQFKNNFRTTQNESKKYRSPVCPVKFAVQLSTDSFIQIPIHRKIMSFLSFLAEFQFTVFILFDLCIQHLQYPLLRHIERPNQLHSCSASNRTCIRNVASEQYLLFPVSQPEI